MGRAGKKREINFLTQNQHYKNLHLLLYIVTVLIITFLYFITLLLFSKYFHTVIFTLLSLGIGIYIVYHSDRIVKRVSDKIEVQKRKNYKRTSKKNLKTTLRKITPKNKNLKLNIRGKTSLKEKMNGMKSKFSKKGKKRQKQDYIEFD